MLVPRWFIPDGIPRPDHLPAGGISVIKGPDDKSGICVGGPYRPGEPAWSMTRFGWYLHLDGCHPHQLLRLAPVDGITIPGILDHQWLVPLLLRPAAGGLRCALPQILTDQGFSPPPAFAGLMNRLRDLVGPLLTEITKAEDEQRAPDIGFSESETIQLAIDLLAVNYHISRTELITAAWLTDRLTTQILLAASGMLTDESNG